MKIVSAVAVIAALVAAMTGFVYLSVKGIDTTAFAAFAGAVLLPQAVALFRQDKTQQMVKDTQNDVAIVKERTNGPLDAQAATLEQILERLEAIEESKGGKNDAGLS